MSLRTQKIISSLLLSVCVVAGLQAMIYAANLYQITTFLQISFWVYVFLLFKFTLLYDLHYKKPGAVAAAQGKHGSISLGIKKLTFIIFSAFYERLRHFLHWQYFRHWQNYLVLPALIFWGTAALFYIYLGKLYKQQLIAVLSSLALIVCFWFLKEVFHRKKEKVDNDIFISLSAVKIYTAFIAFAGAFGLAKWFCLSSHFFVAMVFIVSFWLVYQAIFQHNAVCLKTVCFAVVLSGFVSLVSHLIFKYWSLNNFSAGVMLTTWYNFAWTMLHHKIDKELNWKYFFEHAIIAAVISVIIFSATDFSGTLINRC